MSLSFNKVIIAGNLTKDPEVVNLQGSTRIIVNARLASNRVYYDANGNKQTDVCYVDLKAFGKTADAIAKHCHKGKPVFVEGRLAHDEWDAKDGSGRRSKVYIVVERLNFLDSLNSGNQSQSTTQVVNKPGVVTVPAVDDGDAVDEDDVSF